MSSINKVILVGNVGREIKYLFEVLRRHIEHSADAAGDALEVPDV